jgi:hypothetical protein
MTDQAATPNNNASEESLTIAHLQQVRERRKEQRVMAFCQVFEPQGELLGVSFDLTPSGICLSLPNTWPRDNFEIQLKRMDNPNLPEVRLMVKPMWRQPRNENFDEIGGQIIDINSAEDFETFLRYCQTAGPSGLV